MAEYSTLYIAGRPIDEYRNSIGYASPLFTESDKVEAEVAYYVKIGAYEKDEAGDEDETGTDLEPPPGYSYQTTATAMIDRLEVMGYTMDTVKVAFLEGISALREDYEGYEFMSAEVTTRLFDGFSLDLWTQLMKQIIEENLKHAMPNEESTRNLEKESPQLHHMLTRTSIGDHLYGFPSEDPFVVYRAILSVVEVDSPVVLDYSILVGWVEPEAYQCEPPKTIILTEGSTDKWFLEESLKLLYPHLFDYYSFMDFEAFSMPGSTGHLLNLVKAFLGTGISNPIIALFDNDTAGHDALRQLTPLRKPESIKPMALPDLELAKAYPTIGPQGEVVMDVNGYACSIELYLGEPVLRDASGSLYRVQWAGYNEGMKQYQGEALGKKAIQANFRQALKEIASGTRSIDSHDWSGMKLIFSAIFTAFH